MLRSIKVSNPSLVLVIILGLPHKRESVGDERCGLLVELATSIRTVVGVVGVGRLVAVACQNS